MAASKEEWMQLYSEIVGEKNVEHPEEKEEWLEETENVAKTNRGTKVYRQTHP